MTKIEWCQVPGYKPEVWNPVTGCTRVSPGCDHCYAIRQSHRFSNSPGKFAGTTIKTAERVDWSGKVVCHYELLDLPLRWRQPRAIFVNSMSDLFHDAVPDEFIANVFRTMNMVNEHLYMVLTKRPVRMKMLLNSDRFWQMVFLEYGRSFQDDVLERYLGNVWLGVSAENQAMADQRIPHLLKTPAAVRFVSVEPMLGAVDLTKYLITEKLCDGHPAWECERDCYSPRPDWVICGGESGPGARPMHPDWPRSLRDQCQAANVPLFFKQWGEYFVNPCNDWKDKNVTKVYDPVTDTHHVMFRAKRDNKIAYGSTALLDGKEYHEWPEVS